jgi:hypothetical protein
MRAEQRVAEATRLEEQAAAAEATDDARYEARRAEAAARLPPQPAREDP